MATFTSQPDETDGIDTYLNDLVTTDNYGTAAILRIGDSNSTAETDRALIKFTPLPVVGSVTSATLSLNHEAEAATNTRTLRVYRMLTAWVEGEATWNIYSTGNNWTTAGGFDAADCEQTDIGSLSLSSDEANGNKDISLSTTAIAEMCKGTFTNNGFMLKMDTETDDQHTFSSASDSDVAQRPLLTIEYTLGGSVIMWTSE